MQSVCTNNTAWTMFCNLIDLGPDAQGRVITETPYDICPDSVGDLLVYWTAATISNPAWLDYLRTPLVK